MFSAGVVSLEDTLDPAVVEELRAMGHRLEARPAGAERRRAAVADWTRISAAAAF
jgi:hypothetical protein